MSETGGTSLELGHYVTVVRRHWRLVAIVALSVLVLGALYLVAKPQRATAGTVVNVSVISSDPFDNQRSDSGLIDPQTEVQLARSSAVVTKVAEKLGGDVTAAEVRDSITVDLFPDATVLRINFTASTAGEAREGATAAADAYLDYRSSQAAAKVAVIVDQLSTRQRALARQLVEANTRYVQAVPGSAAATQADSDRQLIGIELDSLLSQINSYTGIDTTGGAVLTSADDVPLAYAPRKSVVLLASLLFGLLLGLVLAFVRNTLDRRVRDAHDVAGAGGGQVLARLTATGGTVPADRADADAFRSLRERVLSSMTGDQPILTVADLGGHNATDVAVNLALAMTEIDQTVELVLPEHPPVLLKRIGALLGCGPWKTVDGHRQGETKRHPLLRVTVPGTDAALTEPASSLLTGMLSDPARRADVTIIAIPPTASQSLRLAAARIGHSFLLVLRERESRIDVIADLVTQLSAVEGVVHGSVLVPRERAIDLDPDPLDAPVPPAPRTTEEPQPSVSGNK